MDKYYTYNFTPIPSVFSSAVLLRPLATSLVPVLDLLRYLFISDHSFSRLQPRYTADFDAKYARKVVWTKNARFGMMAIEFDIFCKNRLFDDSF